jgi:release factor glutamine methyltransferase
MECNLVNFAQTWGSQDYQHMYEPSDDTYLLIDALWADRRLWSKLRPTLCVELG